MGRVDSLSSFHCILFCQFESNFLQGCFCFILECKSIYRYIVLKTYSLLSTIIAHLIYVSSSKVLKNCSKALACLLCIATASLKHLRNKVKIKPSTLKPPNKKLNLQKSIIFLKFHPFQWSFNVSLWAPGPISCILGAREFVCAQDVLTSSSQFFWHLECS